MAMVMKTLPVFCFRVNHRKIRPNRAKRSTAGTGIKNGAIIFLRRNII
jgi:hypothetical protein